MKRVLIFLAVVAVIAIGASFAGAIGNGEVDVNLSGTKEINPNSFQITFAIETTNSDSQKAVAENKQYSEVLYNKLKSMINGTRGDYLKTANYRVTPNYIYNKDKKTLKDYTVYNTVIVFVKDVNSVSKFVDVASTKGVTRVDNLQFKATQYENECNALLGELTKQAKNRANSSVKPLDMQVLGLKSLSTSCSSESNYSPVMKFARANMASGAEDSVTTSTPIESGKINLKANINAIFYVGAKK